jgi:hypothetical protein
MSVFTSIAYGVKGIEWFWGRLMFDTEKPVMNQCGRDVAAINAELTVLGPHLMGLESVDVFHTEPLPRDTHAVPEDYWFTLAESWYPGLCVGVFRSADDADMNDYLLVANTNYSHEKLAVLQFTRPVAAVERLDKRTGEWIAVPLNPGVTEQNRALVRVNLFFQMYSQRTGGDVIDHMQHLEQDWFGGRSGNQFAEVMLAAGDGELVRVIPELGRDSVR